ncbi:MAG: hypothetical protein JKX97_02485 [Candidatus Lindowbacteria bacterium]|nr:hypothetical protein [Candidatus Lindowbacteria bacterium]
MIRSKVMVTGMVLGACLLFASTPTVWAEGDHKQVKKSHANTTIKGEVVDLVCYISHPKTGRGKKHIACAKKCLKGGLPVGLLTKDGLYLVGGRDHGSANEELIPYVAKTVTIKGKISEQSGMKLIVLKELLKVNGKTPKVTPASQPAGDHSGHKHKH